MSDGLRLMVYDRTCRGHWGRPGLSHAWWAGGLLYRALGRFDAVAPVSSWQEAWSWLGTVSPDRPIAEVQYWGHGKWGAARVDCDVFDIRALVKSHAYYRGLRGVRDRMRDVEDSLFWFRTCETLGASAGQAFARDLSDFLGARVAGHTFIIGHIQSGLHSLAPGQEANWSETEGLREGSPDDPQRAYWSGWRAPNTITCLRGSIPTGY
ncbi:MAG: hypothetical protein AAF721_24325 [Myxococcota bacterium]